MRSLGCGFVFELVGVLLHGWIVCKVFSFQELNHVDSCNFRG